MIELENLTKDFGPHRAVDSLNFSVAKGEVLGFLGPNGAGKSTTMRMLTGFIAPSFGTARICGFDIQAAPVAAKSHIGYLPEGAPAWPDMSAEAFLKFAAAARGLSKAEIKPQLARAVEATNLGKVLRQPIGSLSKGFKRRVGLAQALLHDPDVLIMDEPTDGLDPNQKHEVRDLIRAMAGDKAIVISTHILEEVEAVCSRAVVIAAGKIVADETPQELEARSHRHNGVWVTLSADADQAKSVLAALPDVAGVEAEPGGSRLFCRSTDKRSIAGAVAAALREHGLSFEEMHVERGRLDDVFRAITRHDADETPGQSAMARETEGALR
ncbi:MAG: ABC transporter ATP-binding protein [Alphaproteobacteria bacterium]|nr:ABC transporter ATP-binding protein [Alphaproteobacteria bacterium]